MKVFKLIICLVLVATTFVTNNSIARGKSANASTADQIVNVKQVPGENPAPAEKFANFSHFELKPMVLDERREDNDSYIRVTGKVQELIDSNIKPMIEEWNAKNAAKNQGRTLVIEPRINSLKFSSVAKRIFIGPFGGSSYAIVSVKFYDKVSGKEIAYPVFYQRAAAMSGAFTLGGQDNAMLHRVVSLFKDYTQANYETAVGGPTGQKSKEGKEEAEESEQDPQKENRS